MKILKTLFFLLLCTAALAQKKLLPDAEGVIHMTLHQGGQAMPGKRVK